MPKINEYPTASFKNALELAKAVDDLGGSCNIETCANKTGKKIGGGFTAIVSTTSKFGLIDVKNGNLSLTQLYKDYKLSYDEDERIKYLRKVFFNSVLFKKVYEKFKNSKLPVEIFDKALIKEFNVEQKIASRVAGYFIDAAKHVKLLNPDNSFNSIDNEDTEKTPEKTEVEENPIKGISDKGFPPLSTSNYIVQIKGPKINQTIEIDDADHILLVEAALKIIKKNLSEIKGDDKDTQSAS